MTNALATHKHMFATFRLTRRDALRASRKARQQQHLSLLQVRNDLVIALNELTRVV